MRYHLGFRDFALTEKSLLLLARGVSRDKILGYARNKRGVRKLMKERITRVDFLGFEW